LFTKDRPLPLEALANIARRHRWSADPSRMKRALCPDCQPKPTPRKERTMAAPYKPPTNGGHPPADPPKTPTKDQKRLIFMAVDEKYTGEGYTGTTTDQSIADDLKVPRAWVKSIREEF